MGTNVVKVRNGLEQDRPNITPGVGEWIYATDSKRTYMGDGATVGGVSLSKKHFEVDTAADIASLQFVRDGDTCDTTDTSDVFMRVNGTWINIYSPTVPPLVWANATLSSGWDNYDNGMSKVRYAKQGNVVLLEGGSKRDDKRSTDTVLTLPVGFRPQYAITIPVWGEKGVMRLDIQPNGEVILQKNGTIKWVSFNIQFPIGG